MIWIINFHGGKCIWSTIFIIDVLSEPIISRASKKSYSVAIGVRVNGQNWNRVLLLFIFLENNSKPFHMINIIQIISFIILLDFNGIFVFILIHFILFGLS